VACLGRGKPGLSARDAPDDVEQQVHRFVLAQPGRRSSADRLHDPLRLRGGTENDHAGRIRAAGKLGAQAVRGFAGQVAVEHHDLGGFAFDQPRAG
jgi:hypothetical protein